MYTAATKLPTPYNIFQWATPTAINPRLKLPISATDTTITVTSAPLDHAGNPITGSFNFGIATNGYVEHFWAPAGSVSGTTITGVVRGIRLEGLDYTTSDPTLAVAHNQDNAVFCEVSPIWGKMIQSALQGDIATGKNSLKVGDMTAADVEMVFDNDQTSKVKLYYDESAERVRIHQGDDGPSMNQELEFVILRGTTAQLAALPELPSTGMVAFDSTLGKTVFREGGAWVQNAAGGSVADGSETVSGKWQGATAAQQGTAADTGSTGSHLVPMNKNLVKASSGAADENKIAVLNASGKFADGFQNITAANAAALTGGGDASALHSHSPVDGTIKSGKFELYDDYGYFTAGGGSMTDYGWGIAMTTAGAGGGQTYEGLGAISIFNNVYDKNPRYVSNVSLVYDTAQDAIMGFAGNSTSPANGVLTTAHAAFIVDDGTLYASVGNGTSQTKSASIACTLASFNSYGIEKSGSHYLFYLNGSLVYTSTANEPSTPFYYSIHSIKGVSKEMAVAGHRISFDY